MTIEDRSAIVSVVEETYTLTARMLSTDVPSAVLPGIRPDILDQLRHAEINPLVTDEEMLQLLRTAYFDLLQTLIELRNELLGPQGESHDLALGRVGLTGSGQVVKVRGFRRALERIARSGPAARLKWVKKAFDWANIVLGSLAGVPVIGQLAEPIQELKGSVEAQADDDQNQIS
jgi:hypothetical protein